jgi:hypothetical protein
LLSAGGGGEARAVAGGGGAVSGPRGRFGDDVTVGQTFELCSGVSEWVSAFDAAADRECRQGERYGLGDAAAISVSSSRVQWHRVPQGGEAVRGPASRVGVGAGSGDPGVRPDQDGGDVPPDRVRRLGADGFCPLHAVAQPGTTSTVPWTAPASSGRCTGTARDTQFKQPTGQALPRRAVMMAEDSRGAGVIADTHRQATDLSSLQPGDLVFFNASLEEGHRIDHVGIYLGIDSTGHHRVMSSHRTANGPTMGDEGGTSLLDGAGLYAQAFRMAKRL